MPVSDVPDFVFEKNIAVPTRDGSFVAADVIRAPGEKRCPAIVTMTPYGKDVYWLERYPDHGFDVSRYAVWETPDPGWWVPRGYACVRADSRGIANSPGTLDPLSRTDTEDYYDLIEWVAEQPWCNGKIGLLGISFYAIVQWKVAALKPPHLAAIVPWEGANDLYRDWIYHGGIYGNGFIDFWWQLHFIDQPLVNGPVVDWREEFARRPFYDGWYRERSAELEQIEVPLLSAGNWGAFHLHLRGNVEGFVQASSRHKRLLMMTGSHIDPFYTEWGKAEQLRFLDHWLKGEDNGAQDDPPLRLAIRYGSEIEWRDEYEWPLARTRWTKLYLDASARSLQWDAPEQPGVTIYTAPESYVVFETDPVAEQTEITGPVLLRLWVSASAEDMDVFVALRDFGPDGQERPGIGPRGGAVPMAVGWLRASHRELDPERSLPYRPYHKHDAELPLPAEPVALDVEVWPTCFVLERGHTLRLEIRANDEHMIALRHNHEQDRARERFAGENRIHTGPEHESYLLLPVIPYDPARPGTGARIKSAPTRREAAAGQGGRVHTILSGGVWAVELEGYGEISRHPTRDEAIVAGRERARRSRADHVIHAEDGSVEEVDSPPDESA